MSVPARRGKRLPSPRYPSPVRRALDEAPSSPCPNCGHDSKTVSRGVCADCWGVKDAGYAIVFPPEPQTTPLGDWDDLFGRNSPLVWIALVAAVAGIVVAVAILIGLR